MKKRDPILTEIFEKAARAAGRTDGRGGQAALAAALSTKERPITRMAVNQWTRVPDHHVRTIHRLYGVPMSRMLRPEIMGIIRKDRRDRAEAAEAA